jgi:hypothetical protein
MVDWLTGWCGLCRLGETLYMASVVATVPAQFGSTESDGEAEGHEGGEAGAETGGGQERFLALRHRTHDQK